MQGSSFKNKMIGRQMRLLVPLCFIVFSLVGIKVEQVSAATAAGTIIYNTSTAAYSDANSNSFAATSNTITATVQNAPSLTVIAPSAQNVTPAMYVVDTFSLTNTGNASGTFALSTDAAFTGTSSAPTLVGYVLAGAPSGTCSVATPCSMSTLNGQSGMAGIIATTGSATVGVEYTVPSGATNNQTVITTLSVNVIYALQTGAAAETSANATAAPTDTVKTDARLDVQAAISGPSSSGSNITWTVTANNGGGYPALDLQSAKAVLGASAAGIAIFIPMPSYLGTALLLQSQPSAPALSGAASGATAALYYNATACASHPTSGWSTTYAANPLCMAVYVSGGSGGAELPSATGGSSGAASVSSAQISLSFVTNQPTGLGAGNPNTVTLLASSAIGATVGATLSTPILGQGVTMGTQDAATATLLNGIQTNATSSSGTIAPGGASNSIGDHAFTGFSLTHGPYGLANATGWYPGATGSPSADNMHDFTALNVPCTSNSSAGVNGLSCSVSSTGVIIINEVDNTGNSADNIKITAQAPAGYQVQLYIATSCSGGGSSVPSCTQGGSLTTQSASAGSVNATVAVAAGAAYYYEAVYNAASNSATPFTAYTTQITAAGQSGSGTGGDTNDTFNVIYPGGVIQITNSVTVSNTNCPAGESPSNSLACPGGTLSYGVTYANVVPTNVAANLGSEPAFATNPLYSAAGTLVITDDGTANPSGATAQNNWSTYTNGIQLAASDTTANTVITYFPAASTTFAPSQTKLTAQIGGASYKLAPGGFGTITFTVVVK